MTSLPPPSMGGGGGSINPLSFTAFSKSQIWSSKFPVGKEKVYLEASGRSLFNPPPLLRLSETSKETKRILSSSERGGGEAALTSSESITGRPLKWKERSH